MQNFKTCYVKYVFNCICNVLSIEQWMNNEYLFVYVDMIWWVVNRNILNMEAENKLQFSNSQHFYHNCNIYHFKLTPAYGVKVFN